MSVEFVGHFSKVPRLTTRQNMDQPTINVQAPLSPHTVPEMRNRAGRWAFIAGAPELEWNPPKKPKADKEKKRFGKGMRGFADEEDWQDGFEGAEAEASFPTPTVRLRHLMIRVGLLLVRLDQVQAGVCRIP